MEKQLIAIKYNGSFLSISDNTSFEITYNNDIFKTEFDITGIFSYSIKLPFKPNNILLGFPDMIDSGADYTTPLDIEVYLSGNLWHSGKMTIISFDGQYFDCVLNLGVSAQINKDQKIKDLFTGVTFNLPTKERYWTRTSDINANYTLWAGSGGGTFNGFQVTINGADYGTFGSHVYLSTSIASIIGSINGDTPAHKCKATSGNAYGGTYQEIIIYSDELDLFTVAFAIKGSVSDGVLAGEDISYNVLDLSQNGYPLTNQWTLKYPSVNYCFPSFVAFNAYESTNVGFSTSVIVNEHNSTGYLLETIFNTGKSASRPLIPCFFLLDVLKTIFTANGIKVDGPVFTGDLQNVVVWNNKTLDELYTIAIGTGAPLYLNKYKSTITKSNHLPDITVGEFLNNVQKYFGVYFTWDEKNETVYIDYIDTALSNTTVVDVTNKCTKDPKIKYSPYQGHLFKLAKEPADEYSSEQTYLISSGMTQVGINFTGFGQKSSGLPAVKMLLDSDVFGRNNTDFKARFLYYIPETSGTYIAFSNYEGKNKAGTRVYQLDLQLNGTYGIVLKLWWNFVLFVSQSREINLELNYNLLDIENINLISKLKRLNTLFVIKSLTLSVSQKALSATKATLARYYYI